MQDITDDDGDDGRTDGQTTLSANQFGLSSDELDELLDEPGSLDLDATDTGDDIDEILDQEVGLSDDELTDLFEQLASQKLDLPKGDWWP